MPLRDAFAAAARVFSGVFPGGRAVGPSFTTPEEFELELLELGLSGTFFGPRDYAVALERRLGIRIVLDLLNDVQHPAFMREMVLSGRLAESRYTHERKVAVVLVPASLPPLVLSLTALHELAHFAAGDHLMYAQGERLARRPPSADEETRENEADSRAMHALLAGALGPESPYARRIYDPV